MIPRVRHLDKHIFHKFVPIEHRAGCCRLSYGVRGHCPPPVVREALAAPAILGVPEKPQRKPAALLNKRHFLERPTGVCDDAE